MVVHNGPALTIARIAGKINTSFQTATGGREMGDYDAERRRTVRFRPTDLTMGPAWAACWDIGRRYAAIVAGCMNMIGAVGGALTNWATGFLVQRSLHAHAAALGT